MTTSKDIDAISAVLNLKRPFRKRRASLVLLLSALVSAGGVLWWFWSPGNATTVPRFETAAVRKGSLKITVSATGTLKPVNQVEVGSEISGIIREVLVDFNDPVAKGQVLARLDAASLEAQYLQSEASLEVARAEHLQAQADAEETKVNLGRLENTYRLSSGKVPAKQDVDTAAAKHQVAMAQVKVAKANIARAEAVLEANASQLAKASIHSPITGVVLDRSVETGQTVAASLQAPILFTLAEDLTNMMLYVSVDEADVGKIKEGQPADFVVDAYPDKTFPARITQVRFAPQTENGVVTYQCLLKVDNTDLLLRPGMTATAEIEVQNEPGALLVPNAALRFTPESPSRSSSVRERQATGGSVGSDIVSKLFSRPGRGNPGGRSDGERPRPVPTRVWIPDNGKPRPVPVITGASDGISTIIVSGDLHPGALVLTGVPQEVK